MTASRDLYKDPLIARSAPEYNDKLPTLASVRACICIYNRVVDGDVPLADFRWHWASWMRGYLPYIGEARGHSGRIVKLSRAEVDSIRAAIAMASE